MPAFFRQYKDLIETRLKVKVKSYITELRKILRFRCKDKHTHTHTLLFQQSVTSGCRITARAATVNHLSILPLIPDCRIDLGNCVLV